MFPFGAHACVAEVDVETGKVEVVRWLAVDDCGPAINPMLIDGQVHGGVVHGIGQALYEQVVYDSEGKLPDRHVRRVRDADRRRAAVARDDRTETPSPVNSLGVKGIGEAGTIAASPAVLNAVVDALRPLGVDYIDLPLTPMRVWEAIQAAGGNGARTQASLDRWRCIMIPAAFDYHRAESVDDAVRALAEGGEDAKLLAGGQSLLPLMKLRFAAPSLLVDIGGARRAARRRRREQRRADRRRDAPRRARDLEDRPGRRTPPA